MEPGEVVQLLLNVLIPAEEVQSIVSECVTAPVRDLVERGVLEMSQRFKPVMLKYAQVSIILMTFHIIMKCYLAQKKLKYS